MKWNLYRRRADEKAMEKHDRLVHPTPMSHDSTSSNDVRNAQSTSFVRWVHVRYSGTEHEMTEDQRRAYNVKHLGEIGALKLEEKNVRANR